MSRDRDGTAGPGRTTGRGTCLATELLARLLRGHPAAAFALIGGAIYLVQYASWMSYWGGIPGWQNWNDQGRYLASAKAFASLDFNPSHHFYPPLYALVAAPLAWLGSNQPFFFINLLILTACVAILVRLFGPVLGSYSLAGAFALIFLLWPGVLLDTFIIPWTSTPATLLVFLVLFLLMKLEQMQRPTIVRSLLFGLTLGLIVPTRPLDAFVALASLPFWLFGLWSAASAPAGRSRTIPRLVPHLIVAALGAGVGPAVYLASNVLIHGHSSSPYIPFSLAFFSWSTFRERFVSIFFDSASLYLEPAHNLASRFPFVVLGVSALAACLRYGPLWLRAAAVMTAFQFTFYMAYLDLLPNGLFRYLNYHYFRWALWLTFMMLPAACVLLYRRFGARAWIPGVPLIVGALALGCLQFRTTESIGLVERDGDQVVVHLEADRRVDYVDVIGLMGNWQKTFAPSAASIDGRPVPFWFELRTLPAPTGTRFLFLHPEQGDRLEIASSGWTISPNLSAKVGQYDFTLGFPRWLQKRPPEIRPGDAIALDGALGRGIFADGFADFDGRGRRLLKDSGTLRLPLEPRVLPYVLWMKVSAPDATKIDITVDGDAAAVRTIEAGPQEKELSIHIFTEAFSTWRPLVVHLHARGSLQAGRQGASDLSITGLRVD
jgi:hypothetical protein